jgi:uncharacterized membrane protein YkvA (DUF1232 family)
MEQDVNTEPPVGFARFQKRAEILARNRHRLKESLDRARSKLYRHRHTLGDLRHELPILIRMTRAWARRDYRNVPWRTVTLAVGGILYFLSPIDAVPDAIPVIGFLDDAAVIAYVIKCIRDDIDRYKDWEDSRRTAITNGQR